MRVSASCVVFKLSSLLLAPAIPLAGAQFSYPRASATIKAAERVAKVPDVEAVRHGLPADRR